MASNPDLNTSKCETIYGCFLACSNGFTIVGVKSRFMQIMAGTQEKSGDLLYVGIFNYFHGMQIAYGKTQAIRYGD